MTDYVCEACNEPITEGYVVVLDPRHCGSLADRKSAQEPILLHARTPSIVAEAITIGTCLTNYGSKVPLVSDSESIVPFDELAERVEKLTKTQKEQRIA